MTEQPTATASRDLNDPVVALAYLAEQLAPLTEDMEQHNVNITLRPGNRHYVAVLACPHDLTDDYGARRTFAMRIAGVLINGWEPGRGEDTAAGWQAMDFHWLVYADVAGGAGALDDLMNSRAV